MPAAYRPNRPALRLSHLTNVITPDGTALPGIRACAGLIRRRHAHDPAATL